MGLTSEWTGTDALSHVNLLPWDVAGGVVKAVAVRETVAIMRIYHLQRLQTPRPLSRLESRRAKAMYVGRFIVLQNLTSGRRPSGSKFVSEEYCTNGDRTCWLASVGGWRDGVRRTCGRLVFKRRRGSVAATGAATGAATDGGGGESQFGIGIDDKTGQAMFDEQKKNNCTPIPGPG